MVLKLASYAPGRLAKGVALATDGLAGLTWWRAFGIAPAALGPNPTTLRWFVQTITASDSGERRETEDFARILGLILKHFRTQRNPGLLTDEELSRISVPILVLMGEQECFFDPQRAVKRAKSLIPGVEAEVVPHAGHAMTMDRPGYLRERVMRFLKEVN